MYALIKLGGWRYLIIAFMMLGITIGGVFTTLSLLRQEAIQTHEHIAALHARTFEDNFAQTLENINYTIERIPTLSDNIVSPKKLSEIFNDLLHNAPYLRSLSLVDENGVIVASSYPDNLNVTIDLSDFTPIPFGDAPLLRIGAPWSGRDFYAAHPSTPQNPILSQGIHFVPILKKVMFLDKRYSLVGALNTDYFINRYTASLPIESGFVSVWRSDGVLLFSTNTSLHVGSSHFNKTHPIDNMSFIAHLEKATHALISAARLARTMPFLVQIEINHDTALRYWNQERNKVLWINIVLVTLCGLMGLILFLRHYKEVKRQKQQIAYEKQFRLAMEATQTGLWTWNFQTDTVSWDKQCYLLLGYVPDAFTPSYEVVKSLIHPDDVEKTFASIDEQIASQSSFITERRMKTANGAWTWIQVRGKVTEFNSNGEPLFLTGVYINIDAQKQAEELRLSAVAFDSQEAIVITDAENKIIKVNPTFTKITGYSAEEVLGKNPRILNSGRHNKAFFDAMWKALNEEGFWQGELWNKRKNGEIYAEHITITAIRDDKGVVTHFLANFNDITLHKVAQKQIQDLAYRDPLTRLANRHSLQENILYTKDKNKQSPLFRALIFMDLDHFKELNDTFGHDAGDMLLVQVAGRLRDCTREQDTVARLGGDEFIVLLENIGTHFSQASMQAHLVSDKILRSLNQPFSLAHGNYQVGVSIGVTLFNNDAKSAEVLLKEADVAMYQAKEKGRNQICFFEPKS